MNELETRLSLYESANEIKTAIHTARELEFPADTLPHIVAACSLWIEATLDYLEKTGRPSSTDELVQTLREINMKDLEKLQRESFELSYANGSDRKNKPVL